MKSRVADPALRRDVEAAVRRRVRSDDADDVVQATFADVLQADDVPDQPEEFRRFVFGVARNKVFDHFRRQKRQAAGLDEEELLADEEPLSARDILRWAQGELPDSESRSTLEWMLREGDGEKLEHIARDARLPATRVRKRVSRLRKFLRERWAAELMLLGLLGLLCATGALYWYLKGLRPEDVVEREPPRPSPSAPRVLPPERPAGDRSPDIAPAPSLAPVPSAPPVTTALPSASVTPPKLPRPVSTEISPKPAPPNAKTKPRFDAKSSSMPSPDFDSFGQSKK